MGSMAKALLEQFRFTHFIMGRVASDLRNEDAFTRTRDGRGASISWVIGHLCSYRYKVMNLLGAGVIDPFEKFSTEAASDGATYPDIGQLLSSWNETHEATEGVLEDVTDEQLLAAMPGDGGPHQEKKVLDTIVFFAWHEAYHMGTIGMMRLEQGYKATAAMATES